MILQRCRIVILCWLLIVPVPIVLSLLLQGGDGRSWLDECLPGLLAYSGSSVAIAVIGSDLRSKKREEVAGLVQLSFSSVCVLWWLATALILIFRMQFQVRTIVLCNVLAALLIAASWAVGHVWGSQVQALDRTDDTQGNAKRQVVALCWKIEQAARLHPAITPACQQSIRTLCARLTSLPAYRFEQIAERPVLSNLLRGLQVGAGAKEFSEASVMGQVQEVNELIESPFETKR